MATIGTILIQAANQAGGITGSGAPTVAGMGAGGGEGVKDLKHQKVVEGGIKDQNEANTQAPKFWTAAFKKMGIQMGLAGILKQSQIFTSTIGSLFQIFGAFVDVILAPFVPMFIPMIRWLARQLPTVAKAAQWTADKIYKGISAAWNFLFKGGIWKNMGSFITDMASKVWGFIETGFSSVLDFFTDNPLTNWVAKLTRGVWGAITDWYDKTLAGKRVAMADGLLGVIGFTFPGGGAAAAVAAKQAANSKAYDAAMNEGDWLGDLPGIIPKGEPPGNGKNGWFPSPMDVVNPIKDAIVAGWDLINEGGAFGAAGAVAGAVVVGKVLNVVTGSLKLANPTKQAANLARLANISEEAMNTAIDAANIRPLQRGGFWGMVQEQEWNPLRKGGKYNPGTALHHLTRPLANVADIGGRVVLGSGRTLAQSMGLMQGGVGDAAQAAKLTAGQSGWQALGGGDDLAQMGGKPTKLSRAVQAFYQWVQKTGRGLGGAAKGGAAKFTQLFDEGLSLADDVVKLAKVTPGMGFVGGVVRIGFKKVIPGIAGMYMVGETVADLWKMAKSEVDWLGDWKSLNAYSSEAMGSLFARGEGPGGFFGTGLLGMPTEAIANIQSMFGGGTGIADWQDKLTKEQKESGVLSAGKLMDMIIRATTGFGGAALSTFFPGLGTLAGGALYEGGRFATTGINVPGIEGTIGGNESKYGPAQDFSDLIIQAIKEGFSSGVPLVEIR